jgi:hypothetical protein
MRGIRRQRHERGRREAQPQAVLQQQRDGDAAELRMLVPEGVFVPGEGNVCFEALVPPRPSGRQPGDRSYCLSGTGKARTRVACRQVASVSHCSRSWALPP